MYKIFKHRKHPCIGCLEETHTKLTWYNIFPSLFYLFCFCNAAFIHSGYACLCTRDEHGSWLDRTGSGL